MRDLTKVERAARWFFCEDYARGGLSAVEFWKQLPEHDKNNIRQMVKDIEACKVFEPCKRL